MRVRSYLRRSRSDGRGVSIDVQREYNRADCVRREWQLQQIEYIDDGRSAYRDNIDNRPAMQQALLDAKIKSFDVLIVYKLDRLARNEAIYHDLINQFQKAGVAVVSATEPDDPLVRSILGALAAQYSRVLGERIKHVRHLEARTGLLVGPVPFGYTADAEKVPQPNDDASTVLELGELYATGEWSAARLALRFGLHVDMVHNLLNNPTYAGLVRIKDTIHEGKHPAIWPMDLWQRIQAVKTERRRQQGRVIKQPSGMLDGMLVCANCGAPLWKHSRNRYRCATLATKMPGPIIGVQCTRGTVNGETIEAVARGALYGLFAIPGLLDDVDRVLASPKPVTHAKRNQKMLDQLKLAFMRDELSAGEYERRKQAIEAEPAIEVFTPDYSHARALLRNIPALLEVASPEELRPIVKELFVTVYARRDEIIALLPTELGRPLFEAAEIRADEWLKQWEMRATYPPGPLLCKAVKRLPLILKGGR